MTGPNPSSKASRILDLASQGVPNWQIAQTMGCSRANVTKTLQRHAGYLEPLNFRLAPLTPEHIKAIEAEAKASHVSFSAMARAMLADYLETSRETKG